MANIDTHASLRLDLAIPFTPVSTSGSSSGSTFTTPQPSAPPTTPTQAFNFGSIKTALDTEALEGFEITASPTSPETKRQKMQTQGFDCTKQSSGAWREPALIYHIAPNISTVFPQTSKDDRAEMSLDRHFDLKGGDLGEGLQAESGLAESWGDGSEVEDAGTVEWSDETGESGGSATEKTQAESGVLRMSNRRVRRRFHSEGTELGKIKGDAGTERDLTWYAETGSSSLAQVQTTDEGSIKGGGDDDDSWLLSSDDPLTQDDLSRSLLARRGRFPAEWGGDVKK